MAKKTLLVGLGGTGCEIVSRVKKMIKTEDPDLQFVGFDTDGNWGGTDGIPIVYTSRDMTVNDYLEGFDNWQEWFPNDPIYGQRKMTKGAGQSRPLSRLAFAETINSGRIRVLEEAIRNLKIASGEVSPTNFRIMIVSSFAGGTGSGMFIQTALFLRQYIRETYGGEVIIRGLFALPDLFMRTQVNNKQKESMYANAYAALKELNALNRVCLSKDDEADSINMQIDNLFDSEKDRGNAAKKPFDFIFLVDNINEDGEQLRDLEAYKQLMTTATYMQVYSPIVEDGDSREDNTILTVIAGDGKPLYGSVGVSHIVYPYEELVEYCGIRATIEALDDSWTWVDRAYKKADADNRKLMLSDPSIKELDRSQHFVDEVNRMLEDGNVRLSFISNAISETAENGRQIDRTDVYYDSMHDYILDKIKKDEEVKAAADATGVTERQLWNDLISAVNRNETALTTYLQTINDRINALRHSIVQSIMPDDFSVAVGTDNEWNIKRLLTRDNHIVHPLAARLLLYKFRKKIAEETEKNSVAADTEGRRIKDYFRCEYDVKGTEIVETAIDRAGEKNLIRKSRFIHDEYFPKSRSQKKRLDTYCEKKIVSVVFEEILKRLNVLIEQYERFFDSLETIKTELENNVKTFEKVTHSDKSDAAIYLCALPEEKQALYESLGFSSSNSNADGVYDSIFDAMYGFDALGKNERKASKKAQDEEYNKKMSDVFRNSVVRRNINDIAEKHADILDLDVYDALMRENENNLAEINKVINRAHKKAMPLLNYTTTRHFVLLSAAGGTGDDDTSAYTLAFWGIHPDVDKKIKRRSEFFSAGNKAGDPQVVCDEKYSKYEISCYQALYCLELTEIPKFLETGEKFGVFYENYSNQVDEMTEKKSYALTPHLDIRWHNRRYLPMISKDKNDEDDRRTARGMWLALLYGGLPLQTKEGKKVFFASFARMTGKSSIPEEKYPNREILYNGSYVAVDDIYELYKALQNDQIIVRRFIEVFEEAFKEDRATRCANMEFVGPRAKRFAKGLISSEKPERNALNIIARFVSHEDATEREKQFLIRALEALMEEFGTGLTEKRRVELRTLVGKSSRFAKNKRNRAGFENDISFGFWGINED